jgi:hypothetical protein
MIDRVPILNVFLPNLPGPANNALQKAKNKLAEIKIFCIKNNQSSHIEYLRYRRDFHQMEIKLKMMAWMVQVHVIRW